MKLKPNPFSGHLNLFIGSTWRFVSLERSYSILINRDLYKSCFLWNRANQDIRFLKIYYMDIYSKLSECSWGIMLSFKIGAWLKMRHLNKQSKPRALRTEKSRGLIRDFQGTTMASPIRCLTTLSDPEYVETWIRCFEALARVKKRSDRRCDRE